ncbi:M16 family metallopeptidase [Streptococcus sp. DD13]|uniref:M16 family metallopeptidase n=1 Tax=Streptococcus sp. DD13 TaxID=1777881 RepID=UPI000794A2CA|nr:insulinase family protein [Streptococcus sp. DD13]KXT77763.1 Zinc protease [Streptococcus sp. DD13]
MELAKNVSLHYLQDQRTTTNILTIYFTTKFTKERASKRALLLNLIGSMTMDYPSRRRFEQRLAELYGAEITTNLHKKGIYHVFEISLNLVKTKFTREKLDLQNEGIQLLLSCLFDPFLVNEIFPEDLVEIEKIQLIRLLDSLLEDSFYRASLGLQTLFLEDSNLAGSKFGSKEAVRKIASAELYQEYVRMVTEDRVDIFLHGEFPSTVFRYLEECPSFSDRAFSIKGQLTPTKEIKMEKVSLPLHQSVLELGYLLPMIQNEKMKATIVVFHTYFGSGSDSILFQELREKLGIAYTVASDLDLQARQLCIYMGISSSNRETAQKKVEEEILKMNHGIIDEALLKRSKEFLLRHYQVLKDNPYEMMDRTHTLLIDGLSLDDSKYQNDIAKVSPDDLQNLARHLSLQASYYLEGIED